MRLALMQPYFFPYLGYFDLINRVDRWVFFDSAQYMRGGWVNRNRILHPTQGWQYVTVPLIKHSFEAPIAAVQTTDPAVWGPKILGQLMHYKKRAPHYRATMDLVENCVSGPETNLSRRNAQIAGQVCAYLGIPQTLDTLSELALDLGPVEKPGNRPLRLCQAVGATEYLNPPGGAHLYDEAEYARGGVRLMIQEPFEFTYPCQGYNFEPSLSVIDAMMWVSPEGIKEHLDKRRDK
jgi:hypothetical protein